MTHGTPHRALLPPSLSFTIATLAVVDAQQPRIDNGRVTTSPAGSLAPVVPKLIASQTDVAWIGYSVPVVAGERTMCCFESGTTWINGTVVRSDGALLSDLPASNRRARRRCPREPRQAQGNVVKLEGSGQMTVLLRISERQVERVRVFSEECQLDAGGVRCSGSRTSVRPDSIAYLESLVPAQARPSRSRVDGAISAIALHGDAAADASLERLVAAESARARAARMPFWLGNARGTPRPRHLAPDVKEDPSIEVRKSAVFGISQSQEPEASRRSSPPRARTTQTAVAQRGASSGSLRRPGEGVGGHHRAHRTGSRHRREEEGRLRAQPAAERRRRPAADQRRAHEQQPRGQETGDVLARTVEGSARASTSSPRS